MKVLVATTIYPTSENPAFGSFVRTQVEALRQAGVDVKVFVFDGRSRKWMYFKGLIQLHQLLASHAIDLVHAHYSYVGLIARMQWQVPVVGTYHGSDLLGEVDEHGKLVFKEQVITAGTRLLAPLLDAVIVQSRQMANKIPRANVHIIPHEIDFDIFRVVEREEARSILGLDPHKKYLLFAAHPDNRVKRFPLAKAVADYLSQIDPSIELIIVYKETQDRLALYMNACNALVFPSLSEGSPNIVKQAMACNLPIVATDVGDVREVIATTAGCYICDPTVGAFAERLTEILRQCERTHGRHSVQHFDRPVIAQKIIQLYADTLQAHRMRLDHKARISY